ncbi:MAG: metallophosphoesterase family protein [Verrucomicrobia bacterium]|nr:metallophosphoesterase family protein [Verrucomicrobiota bacterium]
MRFAIFGDIHANLEAFNAVLADAQDQGCRSFICLGDIVGYNANPLECFDLVRQLGCVAVVRGNHDDYVATDTPLDNFNPLAQAAIQWSREQLPAEAKGWLRGLPLVRYYDSLTLVHATLDDPAGWGYVLNQLDAAASFTWQKTPICFFGHTHVPRLYVHDNTVAGFPFHELHFEPGKQYFINVGSVGQPRDGDPRAAYGVFDFEAATVKLRRVAYDIERTQAKILAAGLPPKLAERLAVGK